MLGAVTAAVPWPQTPSGIERPLYGSPSSLCAPKSVHRSLAARAAKTARARGLVHLRQPIIDGDCPAVPSCL